MDFIFSCIFIAIATMKKMMYSANTAFVSCLRGKNKQTNEKYGWV